jgi:hypothetical protein
MTPEALPRPSRRGMTRSALRRLAPERVMPSVYVLPDQRLVECRPAEPILRAALSARIPFAHAWRARLVLDVPRRRRGGLAGVL